MRRREFITLICSAAAVGPLPAHAESTVIPTIGYLSTGSSESDTEPLTAFREGLGTTGHTEGKNVVIEYRWAEFQFDRLPSLAANLVDRKVAVIAAIGGTPPALIAKAATSTIPIVFYVGIDPVQFGLVASLSRPGGNMTGVAALQGELVGKRVELIRELVPKAAIVALLVNPINRYTETETKVTEESARTLGLQLRVLNASNTEEIDTAFKTVSEVRADALLVSADLFLLSRGEQIVTHSAQQALPAIYPWRGYVTANGLMSYGPSLSEAYRLVGVYVGKILNGATPADLPVEQATKVEFTINLKTAKSLNVNFPIPLLGRADEVIE